MEIGWIDFSKDERSKILSVLDLLGEKGVLDELGISQIRDAYSDLFFPGTSTIQTRAKYFFIVPYALRDLEFNNQYDFFKLKKTFDKTEKECAHIFLENNPDEVGVIGSRSIHGGSWVSRTPASIYWVGLRKYGFFKGKMSIDQYIKFIAIQKQNTLGAVKLGNSSDEAHDDKNAGDVQKIHLFNIPSYKRDWIDDLDINLTFEEGQFLKNQIIETCPDSLMAYVLKYDIHEFLDISSFSDLQAIIYMFPDEIKNNYNNANSFSEFCFALRVVYNLIVSENKNEEAIREFDNLNLYEISNIDIDGIMTSLGVFNPYLRIFLKNSCEAMKNEDFEELKNIIQNREIFLKGVNRSKTAHPGEYDTNEWFAGKRLDYRFSIAKDIIADIYQSEEHGD
ncbi:DUF6361 family protein [Methanobrevibacter millerae]|uniref:Uncharacterized protein n=1 Tax=Methanobrevibacter millerae TaxID=230361 RepID=A0A0U3CKG0_9EURY|nr:DUF6361 family protein [Methanobrevibacter millerae]ALT69004.1 hypothetical protein sm9_1223 [Methanobrevibacter millerae]